MECSVSVKVHITDQIHCDKSTKTVSNYINFLSLGSFDKILPDILRMLLGRAVVLWNGNSEWDYVRTHAPCMHVART